LWLNSAVWKTNDLSGPVSRFIPSFGALRGVLTRDFWISRPGRAILVSACSLFLLFGGLFTYYYVRFSRMIDARLAGHFYRQASGVYTMPRRISVGESMTVPQLVNYLQNAGYTTAPVEDAAGIYRLTDSSVDIRPGQHSYFADKNPLRIEISGKRIIRIRALDSGTRLSSGEVEPELITNLFDRSREKRRPVRYEELPRPLIEAVLAAEDKRFFEHPGLDPIRILGAAWADIRRGQKAQGASTISMQVARSFFFSTRREWSRKIEETLMALLLEHRFNKRQIFELYSNEVYLGNRGSFAIHGFGEAANAYFGKDVRELNLGQDCFLAGIIRSPNRYSSAERRPDRAFEARDRVLAQMLENKMIQPAEAQKARKMPLHLVNETYSSGLAAYFVDMIKDDLLDRISEEDLIGQSYRIYTTLDGDLQRAVGPALEWGIKNVDTQLARRYALWRRKGEEVPPAQVALVALDPHTGEIRALAGGRDYTQSQLNHVLANRQPGSVFKPFVYAAAFNNAVDDTPPILTPASTVVDEPTTFFFDGKEYSPNNYGQDFYGTVTLRDALTHSLNVATVKVAEEVGYKRVVDIARRLGLDSNIQPTPAVALGAYDMSPLEVAAGYTVFANGGTRCEPTWLRRVVNPEGTPLETAKPVEKPVLDPRVAYLVTNVLEDVINRGTGETVRVRGFTAPAAGKTGTSHDGWFAGYTSNLLCVVWVGFDDNRELGLSGSQSAAPIWAEFMRRATTLPAYRDTQDFERPEGVVSVTIDPETQQLAAPDCPETRDEVFIAGTEPTQPCALHGGNIIQRSRVFSWLRRLFHRKPQTPQN
jgi:penicillin-binding protein 1B